MLATVDEEMRPAVSPQVPGIAQALPADTAHQVTWLADRLGLPLTEIVIEVANAVISQSTALTDTKPAAGLAAGSFPAGPLDACRGSYDAAAAACIAIRPPPCTRPQDVTVVTGGYAFTHHEHLAALIDRGHDHGVPFAPATAS